MRGKLLFFSNGQKMRKKHINFVVSVWRCDIVHKQVGFCIRYYELVPCNKEINHTLWHIPTSIGAAHRRNFTLEYLEMLCFSVIILLYWKAIDEKCLVMLRTLQLQSDQKLTAFCTYQNHFSAQSSLYYIKTDTKG